MKTLFRGFALVVAGGCSQAAPKPGESAAEAGTTEATRAAESAPVAVAAVAAAALSFPATGTPYQRLGGREGVTAIVREATRNHLKNPAHKTRFEVIADPARVEHMPIENFSQAAGGPVIYTGKSMVAAHRGMNINAQEFLTFMDDIVAAMDTLGVSGGAKFELIGMMYRGKEQVLHS